ncbi:MAG: hypothetical protein GY945_17140 [Rhodobacteraceae bacterium]|nr:hypothetical protein [Paracoccaceae bacterium]
MLTQLEHLIATHGRIRVASALITLITRPKRPRLTPERISAHLRRDIGLERAPPSRTYRDFL